MAGRECSAIELAIAAVQGGSSVTGAAKQFGCSRRGLHLALARHGIPSPGPRKGKDHHAWVDGRTARRTSAAATP